MLYVLALEVSTQAAKAMVMDEHAEILYETNKKFSRGTSDIISIDADAAYNDMISCGRLAAEQAGVEISAVGICSIWHSLVMLDENYAPLLRASTWASPVAAELVANARLNHREETAALYKATGCLPHGMYTGWQWLYYKHTGDVPRAHKITTLPGYLHWRLTGQLRESLCNASGSGMLDIHTLKWSDTALSFFEVQRGMLGELCAPEDGGILTRAAADALGISRVPVAAGGGDGGLNQIGAGALSEGSMTFSVGTSGAIRISKPRPVLPDDRATWCYYVAGGTYLAGAATSGACNCVDWFRSLHGDISYDDAEKVIPEEKSKLLDAPIFLPFLYGERCPGLNEARAGGFAGLRGSHGLGNAYYSVLEGVLFNIYHCYTILAGIAGKPKDVFISGGIMRSRIWLQMAADIFGMPMISAQPENASTPGAAALALLRCGSISSLEEFPSRRGGVIHPNDTSREFYMRRFEKYITAYEKGI